MTASVVHDQRGNSTLQNDGFALTGDVILCKHLAAAGGDSAGSLLLCTWSLSTMENGITSVSCGPK